MYPKEPKGPPFNFMKVRAIFRDHLTTLTRRFMVLSSLIIAVLITQFEPFRVPKGLTCG